MDEGRRSQQTSKVVTMSRRPTATSEKLSAAFPPPPDFIVRFCEFLNPSASRRGVDIATLFSAKRTATSGSDGELSSEKLDNALLSLLSPEGDITVDMIPAILGQLGYPRQSYLSPTNCHEKLVAIVWLVAEFDLWEKYTLDNIAHQYATCTKEQSDAFPMSVLSSSSSTSLSAPSSHHRSSTLHFQSTPSCPPASSHTSSEHEHLVALHGKLDHLLRKDKHLRSCRVRNTQALVRTLRRILDIPSKVSVDAVSTGTGTAPVSALSTLPAQACDSLPVVSAAEAVALLRNLTSGDLARLLAAVERREERHHPRLRPHTERKSSSTTAANTTSGGSKASVRRQRELPEKRGVEFERDRGEGQGQGGGIDNDRVGGMSEERHRLLAADLEIRAQQLRQACAQLADARRHQAALYRWMHPLETPTARDASSDLDNLVAGSETRTRDEGALFKTDTNPALTDLVDLAMLRELDSAVESLVLADVNHGACYSGAAEFHRVLAYTEGEISQTLRDEDRSDSSDPSPPAHSPTPLPPRPFTPTHMHASWRSPHLRKDHHPRVRLYRHLLPPSLPEVRPALDLLRVTHRDVLHRTALACAPYSPYTCQFV